MTDDSVPITRLGIGESRQFKPNGEPMDRAVWRRGNTRTGRRNKPYANTNFRYGVNGPEDEIRFHDE